MASLSVTSANVTETRLLPVVQVDCTKRWNVQLKSHGDWPQYDCGQDAIIILLGRNCFHRSNKKSQSRVRGLVRCLRRDKKDYIGTSGAKRQACTVYHPKSKCMNPAWFAMRSTYRRLESCSTTCYGLISKIIWRT